MRRSLIKFFGLFLALLIATPSFASICNTESQTCCCDESAHQKFEFQTSCDCVITSDDSHQPSVISAPLSFNEQVILPLFAKYISFIEQDQLIRVATNTLPPSGPPLAFIRPLRI